MQYLENINDKILNINEDEYVFINFMEHPEYFFGLVNICNNIVDFNKFPPVVQKEMKQFGEVAVQEMNNLNKSPCGVRIRFKTDSSKIIFKIRLKRKWGYHKMVNWNSMGFDVYNVINNEYIHRTVFSPKDGENLFAEIINNSLNGFLCIFLPSYNVIEEMYVGIEKNSNIFPIEYDGKKNIPIIFYGNSITQGAAASRSSNTFPNMISKKLDKNILNLSISLCCRGSEEMADLIGKLNCSGIVIDYTRNAFNKYEFESRYEKFYKKIREYHPRIRIILMTSSNFNNWKGLDPYDEIVKNTYKNAITNNENTVLLNQKNIFEEDEYDYVCIDGCHYTDYGMNKIADEIIRLLKI